MPFEDRGASTRELMSKGLMTRELKYRLPWKQGRRDEGPPSIFQDVPIEPTGEDGVATLVVADPVSRPRRPAAAGVGRYLDGRIRPWYRYDQVFRVLWTSRHRRKVIALLTTNYGGLVPEDELLAHQIVDTFATVSQSDPSWTEKIWTIAHARDNSLQVVLGVGKYTNRGVFDGAAGVCRGTEQWTVRAGRRLSSDPAGTHVGPIHYRVVEPLRAIQVSLDATEHAPIAFDVELRGSFDAGAGGPVA